MRKKAQAAMEFLMTYGWAILVVLAAIGALAYLGILNPENWGQGRCFMTGDFNCQDWDIASDGTFQATILAGRDAQVTGLLIKQAGSSDIDCDINEGNTTVAFGDQADLNAVPQQVYGGQVYSVSVPCGGSWSTGQKLDAAIKLTYTLDGSSISKTLTGEIKNIKVS